jgi:3-phenylpropionate/trans-cinnamate dioxygenase ferredoxin reductase component
MKQETHVIVGASKAGASAAAALRKEGFSGRIILIGEEAELPYERPELSKKYLRGEADVDLAVNEPGFYGRAGIELMTGRPAENIDPSARRVSIGRDVIDYDRLLLATGASARRAELPGADLDGVLSLRTVADADAIRQRSAQAESVVVIGGGWIGSEVAASLRQMGRPVTLVMSGQLPLERVVGAELGAFYLAAHERHATRVVRGARVTGFSGRRRVAGVRLADGATLPAELVIIGIGAQPRTELAARAGIAVRDGILVDEQLQTDVPGIYAAGDVANARHPRYGRRLRVEHIDNAKQQGRSAAANMLGLSRPYDRTPFFYSDQYELGMEYRGYAPMWDEVAVRGELESGKFVAFWLRRGRLLAAMNMNIWDVGPALDALVTSRARVRRERLVDADEPLAELAAA